MADAVRLAPWRFQPGFDPRRGKGANACSKKRGLLRKKLKEFDAKAWATLNRLFDSPDLDMQKEGLKVWAKYRLSCLVTPTPPEEDRPTPAVRLSPELARAIAEAEQPGGGGGDA